MKTVLVVDDDKDIRDMLSISLSLEGWVVHITDSLLGALSILSINRDIAIMLLDYNLPGMPMTDFVTQVRAIAPDTGIVLCSATYRVFEKADKIGLKHCLGKPFDWDELRTAMEACLAESDKN